MTWGGITKLVKKLIKDSMSIVKSLLPFTFYINIEITIERNGSEENKRNKEDGLC
ncbi:MAG: hypothetical protein ACRDBA_03705 [Clostridium sp.]